ncbi:hypothetical protein ACFL3W_01610 [Pseudomonadota bacterium]
MIRNWLQILDEQHKNHGEPIPGLDQDAAYSPIHYLFEIQLMTNQICGKPSAENSADFAWVVKQQHVKRYLLNYHRKHSTLPAGRCYLGMTRPLNLEVGVVDLGAIRRKIRAGAEHR